MRPLVCTLLLTLSVAAIAAFPSPALPYIRVVQQHGIWWFQDSAGHLFFSLRYERIHSVCRSPSFLTCSCISSHFTVP
jgi:hypothetical protein